MIWSPRSFAYCFATDSSFDGRSSMILASHNRSHSASVCLTLAVGQDQLDVAQVTPTAIILRDAVTLQPCDGILCINIDGHSTYQPVRLPQGATAESPVVATAACG